MKRVKWGVLGTAGIAKGQTIPGMIEAYNCDLYAIAGRDKAKTEAFQKEFGFEKMYIGYDALLDDPEVEAIYIPLSNDLHVEWACKALSKKKHVLCEKPLAIDSEGVEKILKTAEANGVHLMEAFAYLHSPVMASLKADIESGIIGKVQYFESEFLYSEPAPTDIRMMRRTYGGATYDLGCYTTSQLIWLLGDEEPETLRAFSTFNNEHIDVFTSATLTFKSGVVANLVSGFTTTGQIGAREDRFIISGTKGMIRGNIEFNQEGDLTYSIYTEEGQRIRRIKTPQNYRLEVEQLGRCIQEGEKPFVSHDFSRKNMKLIERVLKEVGY